MLAELTLGAGTHVRVGTDGRVTFERAGAVIEVLELAPGVAWPTDVVACASRSGGCALVATLRHDAMLWLRASPPAWRRLTLGERLPHSEQLHIEALESDFLVLGERVLLLVDDAGQERWRHDRVTVDWQLVDARDGVVWLADHDGNLLGFDLATGNERS